MKREFKVVRELVRSHDLRVVDCQISASRSHVSIPGSQARQMFGFKWNLWASATGNKPMHIGAELAGAFEKCFSQALKDQECDCRDASSFTMMLWAPWTWDSKFLGPHEDDSWVGQKIIIGNVTGGGYQMGLWSSMAGPKRAPTFLSKFSVRVPSQYTLEGRTRWGMAHGGCFSAGTEKVHKYRLGIHSGAYRAAWKYKGQSNAWQRKHTNLRTHTYSWRRQSAGAAPGTPGCQGPRRN